MFRWLSLRTTWIVFLGLAILTAAWYFWLRTPKVEVVTLKLTTGSFTNPPNRMTQYFLEESLRFGLNLELVEVSGSEASLDKVHAHDLDVALVKGGIKLKEPSNIRQVTALGVEQVHLLVRPELAEAVGKDFAALRGKRINLNVPTTGTYHWTADILAFMDLHLGEGDNPGDFIPTQLSYQKVLNALKAIEQAKGEKRLNLINELPDAVFIIAPLFHAAAKRLVTVANYRLVPLHFAAAYIQRRNDDPQPSAVLDRVVLIEACQIPAYSYGISPAVPESNCPTLGFRRLLVAHKDVPNEAIVRLLRMIYDSSADSALDAVDVTTIRPQYELHPGVSDYVAEKKQVMQTTIRSYAEKALGAAGAAVGGIIAIWGYFHRRRLLRYNHYYQEIGRINLIAMGKEVDPAAPRDPVQLHRYLDEKLVALRTAAIAEFAEGRLQGEMLVIGIFQLIADTSVTIQRLLNRSNDGDAGAKPA